MDWALTTIESRASQVGPYCAVAGDSVYHRYYIVSMVCIQHAGYIHTDVCSGCVRQAEL